VSVIVKTSKPIPPQWRAPTWVLPLLLIGMTVALYWSATRCGFINLDDPLYVTDNDQVREGLSWENIRREVFEVDVRYGYWHPLTLLSHMLDCQLYGLNPWGHHLTSVLLHAINTSLLFLLFRRMTGAFWRSAMVAVLFGWHPLHVESVAWVSERKDVLSTCFGLLALLFYDLYVKAEIGNRKSEIRYYLLTLLFYLLNLMSKPMLVTFPFVLFLLDWWPLRRFYPGTFKSQRSMICHLVVEKIPFFALL
jgi:hypothetical protein